MNIENGLTPVQIYRDSKAIVGSFSKEEKNQFLSIKREILRNFKEPNFPILTLVNLVATEYIRYMRCIVSKTEHTAAATCVKNITATLAELRLTPASEKSEEVSGTLSQILAAMQRGDK